MRAADSDQATEQSELSKEQLTVRQLMHLDMDQALQQARSARRDTRLDLAGLQHAASSSPLPTDSPALTALYGTGKTKFAHVQFGTESLLFMQGRSAPVGMKSALAPYRLKDIQGKCVTLESRNGDSTLCISSPAWER